MTKIPDFPEKAKSFGKLVSARVSLEIAKQIDSFGQHNPLQNKLSRERPSEIKLDVTAQPLLRPERSSGKFGRALNRSSMPVISMRVSLNVGRLHRIPR